MNSISTFRHRSIGSADTLARTVVCASLLYVGAYVSTASIAHADGSGWFTQAQADRGRVAYGPNCGTCHGDALQGTGAPALKGTSFVAQWNGKALTELYTYVHKQMPLGKPDSLTAQQYADIVAFMLAQNGLPAGTATLTPQSPMDGTLTLGGTPSASTPQAAAGTAAKIGQLTVPVRQPSSAVGGFTAAFVATFRQRPGQMSSVTVTVIPPEVRSPAKRSSCAREAVPAGRPSSARPGPVACSAPLSSRRAPT